MRAYLELFRHHADDEIRFGESQIGQGLLILQDLSGVDKLLPVGTEVVAGCLDFLLEGADLKRKVEHSY